LTVLLWLAAGPSAVCLGAGPVYWDYPDAYPFSAFDLEGTALDACGRLVPGLASEELLAGGPEVVWRVVGDDRDGLYAATGHGGEVWHIDRKGQAECYARLPEPEIFCLLLAGEDLFAGGGPDGLLYRLPAGGEPEAWADLPESYIWDMAAVDRRKLYLAVGSPAAVYTVTDRLATQRLATFPAANALALHVDDEGFLWVATEGPGLIYRLDAADPDRPRLIYETDQDEVRQFLTGPQGDLHALAVSRLDQSGGAAVPDLSDQDKPGKGGNQGGASQQPRAARGALYRLAPDGFARQVWASDTALMTAAYSQTWGWLGAGLADPQKGLTTLQVLELPQGQRPLATWEGGDALAMLVRPQKSGAEEVIMSLARPGRVLRLLDRPAAVAVATCQPLDGLGPIRWGRLRWEGTVPDQASLLWSARGGPRSIPDETWTDWIGPWEEADHALDLPPTRYLQWRVEFSGQRSGASVRAVTVSGYEPNSPPQILRLTLEPEGQIATGGLMAREDNVTETFTSGLRVQYDLTSRQDRKASLLQAAPVRPVRTFTWHATDPNEDRLLYQLEYRHIDQEAWRPVAAEGREPIGSWDTTTVPDGWYIVRLKVSDRLDNLRDEACEVTRTTGTFLVDHTPPSLKNFKVRRIAEGFALSLEAADTSSPLAQAWIELPDGRSERLDPEDGICDSHKESFAADFAFPESDRPPVSEPWRVRVAVSDRLGNVATTEGEVR
jgi:hypothetical protein